MKMPVQAVEGALLLVVDRMPQGVWGWPFNRNPDTWLVYAEAMIPRSVVENFLGSLVETEGYVEGEWDEYEALLEALGDTDDE